MSEKTVKVTYNRLEVKEFPIGTTLKQISKSFQHHYGYEILVAKVDNDITELCDVVTKKCTVDFYDRSSSLGYNAYVTSATFMMIVAVRRLYGDEIEVIVDHSMDKGVFCRIEDIEITDEVIDEIEREMRKISREDHLFKKLSVSRADAIKFYKKKNQEDKVNVLKYISNTYINLYKLDDVYDYYYTKMVYSTRQINDFKIAKINERGFVLSFPTILNPECTLDYHHHKKVFEAFQEYGKLSIQLNLQMAADLNKVVSNAKIDELIRLSESYYNTQLVQIAENIYDNRKKVKLVLLAGPSSSGKTTTAKKLMTFLKSRGVNVIQLSTDDYFVNKEDTPKNEKGEFDFESLYTVDLDLFNKHLMMLLEGSRVEIPSYNFVKGKREYHKNFVKLQEDDIVIIEGIHALNDLLTMSIDRINKYKLYISPLVQLNIDNHSHVHTSDVRRLRRIIRDSKTRGYGASQTLAMWASIERGEQQNIYPFQDEVDVVINSSLIYEIGVLKTYVEPLLFCVNEDDPVYPEALRLINFLRNFLPIPSDDIPPDSVLREFIGGSCFKH
jgi:Uridine kinase